MKKTYFIFLAFIVGIGTGLYLAPPPEMLDERDYHKRLKLYRENIELLSRKIEIKQAEIDSFAIEVIELRAMIGEIEKEKQNIIKYYDKKIADIDTFNLSQLDGYFTERYPARVEGEDDR